MKFIRIFLAIYLHFLLANQIMAQARDTSMILNKDNLHLKYIGKSIDTIIRGSKKLSQPDSIGKIDTEIVLIEKVLKDISISNSSFPKSAQLDSIYFKNSFFISRTTFHSNLYLSFDTFLNHCDFLHNITIGNVYCDSSSFNNKIKYYDDTLAGDVNFLGTSFFDEAYFTHCNFGAYSYFNNSHFIKSCDFSSSKFKNELSFTGVILSQLTELKFTNSLLPDTLDFSDIEKIYNDINFLDAALVKDKLIFIKVYQSDISKFRLDYTHFKLLLVDGNKELSPDQATTIYEALLKNFKDRGQDESYENLDIEFNDYKGRNSNWFNYIVSFISHRWDCYGYEKWRIFIWTILIPFCYSIMTFFLLDKLTIKHNEVYKIDGIPSDFKSTKLSLSDSKEFRKRLRYSLIYTSAIFFLISVKPDKIKFNRIGLFVYVLIVYLSGLVCLGFLANLILQKS
jgi:hypothetical protein